jgi:CHAT domain-containing protein/tetratricopeptide (TPR) repeat protein
MGSDSETFEALARLEQNRSIALRNLGQFEASIEASQQAWEMLVRSGQKAGAARAQQSLAVTYFMQGRYNEALELLDQARDFFMADGRLRDAIVADLFMSDCLLQLGRFADVLEKCAQIRDLFTELGAGLEVAQAILNEATAYAGLHRYPEALASLQEARLLFQDEGNDVWVACTDLETAAVLNYQGQFEQSLGVAQTCAGVFRDRALPVEEARAYLIAARAAESLNQQELSQHLINQALAVKESQDVPLLTYQSHHLMGSMAHAHGDAQQALAEYDRAINELERMRGRLMIEFRADFLEDKQTVYEDVVALCLELDQPIQGLEYAERAKSRALLDLLAYRLDLSIHTRRAEDSGLAEELMRLRTQRDRVYRRWEASDELRVRGSSPCDEQHEVRRDVLALEKRITELWHKLLIRNADYARDISLWQVHADQGPNVQSCLDPDTALVEYFCTHQQFVAFVVTADEVYARRLPLDIATVRRLAQLLRLNLKAVPRSQPRRIQHLLANAQGLLFKLYELLVAPLSDILAPYSHLCVVPHGPLHYLPFHALYDGHSYLLERYEISHIPAASLLRYCLPTKVGSSTVGSTRSAAQPATSGLLAFGHSYGGRLAHTVQEARTIASLLGGQAFVEEEATQERLERTGADYRALHLATHGDFRPDNPLFSGLVLADGWLTTLDAFDLHFNASLITLSACQTGQSVIGGGDELLGLMRAFLYAGTASLLLSLWVVEDRSAAQLMEAFYLKLAQGCRKGAALRHAQLQFINKQGAGEYAHPYFWAPFFLVGDAGPL